MNRSALHFLGAASFALCAAASLNACVIGRSSGSSSSAGYRGTVTVTNASGLRVCAVEPDVRIERHPAMMIRTEIAPGASATLTAERDFIRVQITECGTNRLLYGDPHAYLNDRQTHQAPVAGQITLLPPGAAAPSGASGWQIPLEPIDLETATLHFASAVMSQRSLPEGYQFLHDAGVAGEGLALMRTAARRAGWTEQHTLAMVVSSQWQPITERRVGAVGWSNVTVGRRVTLMIGAHHQTGLCSVRGQDVRQAFDGESPQGPLQLGGIGNVEQIPCAVLDAMASLPGVSTGG